MSVVVGVNKAGQLAIASDSLISFGSTRVPQENCVNRKIRQVGQAWLGSTGWSIYGNIFQDLLAQAESLPDLADESAIFKWFNLLWKQLHEAYPFVKDQANDDDSPFGDLDSSFLIVNPQGIFGVAPDTSVTRFQRYFAIGSGGDFALGALHALYDEPYDAPTLAKRAVETAIAFKGNCAGPVQVYQVNKAKEPQTES